MTLTLEIPDGVLKRVTELEMRVELACRLFDSQRLNKFDACALCGLTRDEFDAALVARGLPLIRYTNQMLLEDMRHAGVSGAAAGRGEAN